MASPFHIPASAIRSLSCSRPAWGSLSLTLEADRILAYTNE